jgi:replicative DNA helicase
VGINDLITPAKTKLGIEPPFAWLRNRMRFEPKTFTVLAAETGAGKSAFALQTMLCAAYAGHRTALYTLEMSNEQEVSRLIGQDARLNMHRLRIGEGEPEEATQASSTAWKLAQFGDTLLLRDTGMVTIPIIRQHLHRWRSIGKEIKFLIADYLQLMSGVGKFGTRAEEVASMSRGLKLIAQDFGIPVLALSQFSRPKEGKKGQRQLNDLKESSGIEQDANHVIFLERITEDEEAEVQQFLIHLKKQRSGPKGAGRLTFTQRYTRFDEEDA